MTLLRIQNASLFVVVACALGIGACQDNNARNADLARSRQQPMSEEPVQPRINAATYIAHGHLLERQGLLNEAAEQYRQSLKLRPDSVVALNRLGIVLNKLGRHSEACGHFTNAVKLNPGAAYLWNNLGFSQYLSGDDAAAIDTFARAIQISPNFARAHANRGLALGRLQRFAESYAAFRTILPEHEARYNTAVLMTECGDYAGAARSLELSLQADPNYEPARGQLQLIARLAATAADRALASGDEPVKSGANSSSAISGSRGSSEVDAAFEDGLQDMHSTNGLGKTSFENSLDVTYEPSESQTVVTTDPECGATTPAESTVDSRGFVTDPGSPLNSTGLAGFDVDESDLTDYSAFNIGTNNSDRATLTGDTADASIAGDDTGLFSDTDFGAAELLAWSAFEADEFCDEFEELPWWHKHVENMTLDEVVAALYWSYLWNDESEWQFETEWQFAEIARDEAIRDERLTDEPMPLDID